MSDPFHSSKSRIARAKHHVQDLDRRITAFFNTEPYGQIVEVDPNTSEKVYKYKLIKPMPSALTDITVDAIGNIHAALDPAVFAVRTSKRGHLAHFPIRTTEADFENAVNGISKDVPKEIVDLIRTFKPYKGGNDLLWALHKLRNANEHGIISPTAVASNRIHFHSLVTQGGGPNIKGPVWDRTKNEMEIFRLPPGAQASEADFTVTTHIAICGVEIVDGQPVITLLNEFTRIVEGIVMTIEAESRRLGLF